MSVNIDPHMCFIGIVKAEEHNFNKEYIDPEGCKVTFVGIMYSEDDFYYAVMPNDGITKYYSCVMTLEGYGFTKLEDK